MENMSEEKLINPTLLAEPVLVAKTIQWKYLEPCIWLMLALAAYIFSADFSQDMDIYKFGASGWPRMIIFLIVVVALFEAWDIKRHSTVAQAKSEKSEDEKEGNSRPLLSFYMLMGLPLLYAALLETIGFYVLTPLFIFSFMFLVGERRKKILISVTVGLYAILLLLFSRIFYLNLPVGNMHPFYDISNAILSAIN